jgi:hypothetical protein
MNAAVTKKNKTSSLCNKWIFFYTAELVKVTTKYKHLLHRNAVQLSKLNGENRTPYTNPKSNIVKVTFNLLTVTITQTFLIYNKTQF